MKKIILVIPIITCSTIASAFDYKINFDGRADFVNTETRTTTRITGDITKEKWNNISNQLVRMSIKADINENFIFKFRYRFLASSASPATLASGNQTQTREQTSGTNTQLDHFYLEHKHSAMFSTRFGKTNWGGTPLGREGIVAGTDVFLTSLAITNYKTGFGSDYRYGITAMLKFMDTHSLDLTLSNPNNIFTDTTGLEKRNTGLAFGAIYMSSFANKMVQPVLAYQIAKQNGDKDAAATARTKDTTNTMTTVGLRSEFSGLILDADYKEFVRPKSIGDAANVTSNKLQRTKSIYANLAYAIGEFTSIFTYINDKYKTEEQVVITDANFKRNSFALGTYYKPMADQNFRYHLMVLNAVSKYEGVSTNTKVTDTRVLFGVKVDI